MNQKKDSVKTENDGLNAGSDRLCRGADIYYQHQTNARRVANAADAEKLSRTMSRVWERILKDKLPQDKTARIYEAGCGPGAFLLYLRSCGYLNLAGSDFSEPQVKIARANGFDVKQADSLEDLESFETGVLDCIIAIDFIEHLEKDKAMRFITACGDKLKRNGILILRMPNGDSPFVGRNLFNDITHQWAYTTVSMRALLEIAGFSKIEFNDESEAAIECCRFIKIPLMRIAQWLIKSLIRAATREQIEHLSPSIFVFATK